MIRNRRSSRILVISACLVFAGCVIQNGQETHRQETRLQNQQALQQRLDQIRRGKLPQNYKEVIDAHFAQTLKDPDSRKVEYISTPYGPEGSLVCGAINARNSYGGYTGKQPFYAYFNATGALVDLEIFSSSRIDKLFSRTGRDKDATPGLYAELYISADLSYALLKACNILH